MGIFPLLPSSSSLVAKLRRHNKITIYLKHIADIVGHLAGYMYFYRLRHTGWKSLAGIFLAFTGSEATFADIGHFGKDPVRASFVSIAYPSLLIT